MKTMKGRILTKLKSISQMQLKQGRLLQLKASDGFFNSPPPPSSRLQDCREDQPQIIDATELMMLDLDDEEEDKENIKPASTKRSPISWRAQNNEERRIVLQKKGGYEIFIVDASEGRQVVDIIPPGLELLVSEGESIKLDQPLTSNPNVGGFGQGDAEIVLQDPLRVQGNHEVHSYRLPDLNSLSLFDPNLLAAFQQAVKDYFRAYELLEEEKEKKEEVEPPLKIPKIGDLLREFDEKCPPGGTGTVIFYSTSLRGVRNTFEGCNAIRFLLESSKVLFYERDVSMHREFREELKRLLGFGAIPPRLFIDGRYIGAAEEVLRLHEQGILMGILKEMPRDQGGGVPCWRCGGAKFLVCERCDGSRRMYDELAEVWGNCCLCNENGLVVCPLCCY